MHPYSNHTCCVREHRYIQLLFKNISLFGCNKGLKWSITIKETVQVITRASCIPSWWNYVEKFPSSVEHVCRFPDLWTSALRWNKPVTTQMLVQSRERDNFNNRPTNLSSYEVFISTMRLIYAIAMLCYHSVYSIRRRLVGSDPDRLGTRVTTWQLWYLALSNSCYFYSVAMIYDLQRTN